MKVKFELDIPKDTYSRITKWLKSYGAEGTLAEMLQHNAELTVVRWRKKADAHFKTGLNAFERYKAALNMEDDDAPS